jgi:CO dehydrogenase/acetyl-CoA synthase beta subunit
VTAQQMKALFGCGLHPLAELRLPQLEGPDLTERDFQAATRLGTPFKTLDGDVSPFRVEARGQCGRGRLVGRRDG